MISTIYPQIKAGGKFHSNSSFSSERKMVKCKGIRRMMAVSDWATWNYRITFKCMIYMPLHPQTPPRHIHGPFSRLACSMPKNCKEYPHGQKKAMEMTNTSVVCFFMCMDTKITPTQIKITQNAKPDRKVGITEHFYRQPWTKCISVFSNSIIADKFQMKGKWIAHFAILF